MLRLEIEEIRLDLKYAWKIARNTSGHKTNFIVSISDGTNRGIGEVAPNVRYGETPESIRLEFEGAQQELLQASSATELLDMIAQLPLSNALRFGLESAAVHYTCAQTGQSVAEYLGIAPAPTAVQTAYTLPIMPIEEIQAFISHNDLQRFKTLKVKINHESGADMVDTVLKLTDKPLMIDANEAWQDVDALIRFMEKLDKQRIEFVEQPMPAAMTEASIYLKKYSPFKLIADESVTNTADFAYLAQAFDGINMKLMKAGGYLNGLRLLNEARARSLKTMIGCMVETSLGISSAMNLCKGVNYIDLDGFLILQNEPFRLVTESKGLLHKN